MLQRLLDIKTLIGPCVPAAKMIEEGEKRAARIKDKRKRQKVDVTQCMFDQNLFDHITNKGKNGVEHVEIYHTETKLRDLYIVCGKKAL